VIRLRRGDLPAAEEALLGAHARGRDPEPALSILRLAQGRVEEARGSIRRAIDQPATESAWGAAASAELNRIWLLPAQVEIALAAGDVTTARAAADALTEIAARVPSVVARAAAATASGQVALAEGDAPSAAASLRTAVARWDEVDAPWERARALASLAAALAAEGDVDRAMLELQAARATFEELGAAPDLRAADEALAALRATPDQPPRPERARRNARVTRTFAFTDIVDSTKLAALLGDEAWERVIAWHNVAIRAVVAEHLGEVVKATGDGFFLAFERPDQAIDAAIGIQRRFDEQRRTQGFAPAVRIGLHEAEAGRSGLDYVGGGVNEAARIGGAASGGEVLASAPTLEQLRTSAREIGRRTVELKGIQGPVEVVAIDWR
jgi:class 3 adenylate cyclase